MTSLFRETVQRSLDNDLKGFVGVVPTEELILTQMLRIMRGRPFHIELNGPGDSSKGWTPDGQTWYPSQPGTFTTGGNPVPPTEH